MEPILTALNQKNWMLASALIVVLVVAALRSWKPNLKGKWAWLTAILTGAALAVANPVIAGQSLGGVSGVLTLVLGGIATGLTGAGLVKGVKEFSPSSEANSVPKDG